MSYRGPGAGETPTSCGPGRVKRELGCVCLGPRWAQVGWPHLSGLVDDSNQGGLRVRVPRFVEHSHERATVRELGALGEGGSGQAPGRSRCPPACGRAPGGGVSYLDKDVGAGAMEAEGPGVERGDEGASLQGTTPWAGPLLTLPVAPRAPAMGDRRDPAFPSISPLACTPSPAARHSPGLAGGCCDLPGGINHPAEHAGALGLGNTAVVF